MNKQEYIDSAEQELLHTYNRFSLVLDHGEGVYLYDTDGKQYLDFAAGIAVCALGYGNKDYNDALKEQVDKLLHTSNLYYNVPTIEAAKKALAASTMDRVFFTNSGTEAIEGAIKAAKKYAFTRDGHAGHEIIAMNHSFHGRSIGALSVTGNAHYQEPFEPLMPGVKFADFNNLDSVKAQITDKTCAIIMETVQGEGGIYPAEKEFLEGVRALCDEKDILLILDEIQCGMGRTGTLFAWQGYGVEPDAFSLAKALGNGYPIAAMVAKRKHEGVLTPGTHASTFGGTPLASAAACAVVDTLCNGGVLENCKKQGAFLTGLLKDLMPKHACIKEVRGKGLMVGVVLDYPAVELLPILRSKGMIALTAGETVLRLVPPLIVTEDDCRKAAALIDAAISEHDGAAK